MNSKRSFSQILTSLIIVAGVLIGVYLTFQQQIFKSKAGLDATRVVINDGADVTNSSSVKLTLTFVNASSSGSPGAFPTSFRVANSERELQYSQEQTFDQNNKTVSWQLPTGNGLKTVFAQYKVGTDFQSPVSSKIILEDPSQPAMVSVDPTNVSGATNTTVVWSNFKDPTSQDWIGLFKVGDADLQKAPDQWFYTGSCSSIPNPISKKSAGSCSYTLPSGLTPGLYEFRGFRGNDTSQKLAVSPSITVGGVNPIITLSKTSVPSGADTPVEVAWNLFPDPRVQDYIALFKEGTPDPYNVPGQLFFTSSCNKVSPGTTARTAGSCTYIMSSDLNKGTYEFRGFHGSATNQRIIVSQKIVVE